MIHIFVWIIFHFPFSKFQKIFLFSKGHDLSGTDLCTGRKPAIFYIIETEGALSYLGSQGFFIFIGRNLKRACDHAIPASDAFFCIINNRAISFFCQRPYDTSGYTGGIIAVHTLKFHKSWPFTPGKCAYIFRIIFINDGIGSFVHTSLFFKNSQLLKRFGGCRKAVTLVAGLLTLSASNTKSRIY